MADKCQAVNAKAQRAGSRCSFNALPGKKLCYNHTKWGALIPDGWVGVNKDVPLFLVPHA